MLRQPLLRATPQRLPTIRPLVARRTFFGRRRPVITGRAVERLNLRRLAQERDDYDRMRRTFLTAGAVAGIISFVYTAFKLKKALDEPTKLDSSLPSGDPLVSGGKRKVVLHDEAGHEVVPTGNSAAPTFPRTIDVPNFSGPPAADSSDGDLASTISVPAIQDSTEYTLVGLGLRSVSFLSINVYVVGFYVATADIAALQSRLVKKINPIATTLVPGEKDELRKVLLDPVQGEELWDELLREGVLARSAFRVVPVRDTDFHHLRDGFVRSIQVRSDKIVAETEGQDADQAKESFGEAVRQFRHAFNRGKMPKAKELLLVRERPGTLRIVYSDGSTKRHRQLIGTVEDERLSRSLWLNWLGGKKVASEAARASIADGVMEFVERPVGTVAAQVL